MLDVVILMRLLALLFAASLAAGPAGAQPVASSPKAAAASAASDGSPQGSADPATLPVSLAKIKGALEQPPPVETLRGLSDQPTYKISIEERQRVKLEDLVNSLNFKSGPTPAGGLYGYEQQRQMFPAVDNPLRQPYSEFSQPELTTILVENLAGHYLASRAAGAITGAMRSEAEARAREDVVRAITEYCAAQPRGGAGIQICANPSSIR